MKPICLLAVFSLLSCCSEKPSPGSVATSQIKDPSGLYALRCDASITRHPAPDVVIGNGQVVEFHYDGSKGEGLTYDLFYVTESGDVQRIAGASLDKKADGIYSRDIKVFNASAHQRPGFMEIGTMANTSMDATGVLSGKFVSLGMFPVRYEIKE